MQNIRKLKVSSVLKLTLGYASISTLLVSAGPPLMAQQVASETLSKKKELAPKPPLGWNSWNSYRNHISEKEVLENLEIFAKKLKPHGYEYFVIDSRGWYSEHALIPGSDRPWRGQALDYSINEYGYPVPSKIHFPNGFKPIISRARELGVKFGLHFMRGVLRKAYEFNLPVKGTSYRIRDIANPKNTCSWSDLSYGIDMSKPGAQEYYRGMIDHIANMEVDFIKYDDIIPYPDELEAVGNAVAAHKRDMVLSLSPGDTTTPDKIKAYEYGHMLRITPDAWDRRVYLDQAFQRWHQWQGQARPGFWPDMDLITLGTLTALEEGWGNPQVDRMPTDRLFKKDPQQLDALFFRQCRFSRAQERTCLTLRALAASPLFMGGCLIRSEQRVFDMLTQKDILECNQNGLSGKFQSKTKSLEVWRTPMSGVEGQGWIGVFNRDTQGKSGTFNPSLASFGLPEDRYQFKSVWTNDDIVLGQPLQIESDDVLFLTYTLRR